MTSATAASRARFHIDLRCYYRPFLLILWGGTLLGTFWFASRYPSLVRKAQHIGAVLPSMAFDHEVLTSEGVSSVPWKVLASSANWLRAMAIGMSFAVAFGGLLHTVLRYYPLKIGTNLRLNSLKGALVGAPMGVCANCAVPMACGVTRGHGRVEVALGYLFSSPNFNPVVLVMTFAALPWYMGLVKYVALVGIILLLVPMLVAWLERRGELQVLTIGDGAACELPLAAQRCEEPFLDVARELATAYAKNVWMLVKPTFSIMLVASLLAAVALTFVPWSALLADLTWPRAALLSFASVFMPVPIALDVMFAAQLQASHVASGYVMLFLMTLGTYSIVPTIYLWREVSKRLAVILFGFFWLVGFISALAF